jgi:UDPglucose--hexose-1-phosphate uridylyltransferase
MSELRKDPVTGRWVIVSTDRKKRISDFERVSVKVLPDPTCPFCEGHEHMTPHELMASRVNGSGPNGPGWTLRVVPNQVPVLHVEGALDRQGEGLFDKMSGIGAHEVIIESPRHDDVLASLSENEIDAVLWAARERVRDLRNDRRFKSIIIFKNHGATAGATVEHSHSQLVALPIVPRDVRDELLGAHSHFQAKERCVFCDILRQETRDGTRLVAENADMVALAPYASRYPFETWIMPRRHQSHFEEAWRHEYASCARLISDVLRRMNVALENPPYNLLIHSAPVGDQASEHYHWHVEILPRVTRLAGFERATGCYVNPTSPEEAAEVLRAVRLP